MTDLFRLSCTAFHAADEAWQAHLTAEFGARAGDVRYTAEGRGAEGTALRLAYEARMAALRAWAKVENAALEAI